MIMQSPCFSLHWGQRTIANLRRIFMTQASGALLPYRIPTLTSPSHSPIAAQSSLGFDSRVGFVLGFFQGHVAHAVTEQIWVKNNPFLQTWGNGWSPPLVIFCLNSCQQVPQLMKGKWNSSSFKKSIPSLLLITSQQHSDEVTDSKYDAIISLQFISTYAFLHSYSIHPSYFPLMVSKIYQELLICLCNPLFFAVIKCFPPTQPKYLFLQVTELSSVPHRKSKICHKSFLTAVVAFHQIKSKIRIATSNQKRFIPPARRGKGKEAV